MTNKITFDDTLRAKQVEEVRSEIDCLYACGKIPGAPSGCIQGLESFIPGFRNGTLTVFAPEQKADVTVLFYNLFSNISKAGTKALCISLGSSEAKVMKTCIAMQSHVPLPKLYNGLLTMSEFEKLDEICGDLCRKDTVNIIAPEAADYVRLEEIVEDAVKNSGVQIVFLEDIHLAKFPSRISSDQKGMAFILRKLKRIAHSFMLPIITTAPGSLFVQSSPIDLASSIRSVDTFIRLTVTENNVLETDTEKNLRWRQEGIVEKNRDGLVGSFSFIVDYREMRISEEMGD